MNSINRHSWYRYAYLVKSSLMTAASCNFLGLTDLYIQSSFFLLSDISSQNIRNKFKYHRTLGLSKIDDLDYFISSYHYKFDYYSVANRARSF